MSTNDVPFEPLPAPPRDPTQSDGEADVRGYDRDDEHARAIAHKEHLRLMAQAGLDRLTDLEGQPEARKTLQRKWQALVPSSPSYVEEG